MGLGILALLQFYKPENAFVRKPRLDCESAANNTNKNNLMPILDKVKKDVQMEIEKKEVKDIALYYRDLKNGAWCAINKDEKFNIASLMKVPLMIECLESAESHPSLFRKRMPFTSDTDWTSQQNIKPIKTLERGKLYSLDDILFRMIAYSDNNAMELLLEEFPSDNLDHFLADHNIDYEKAPDGFMMSLGTYSWFFEALYDKSLLNSDMSKKALSYLAAEEFPQGMHAVVPANVVVESKFGEKLLLDENGKVLSTQLHEVGIVLNGDHPFLLGIMTSGEDLTVLEKIIREITYDVYEVNAHTADNNQNQMDCTHSRCHV